MQVHRLLALLSALTALSLAFLVGTRNASAARERVAVLDRIDQYRAETWRWQGLMGRNRTRSTNSARKIESWPYRHWVLGLWRDRADRARRQASSPPHLRQWLCIHRFEGAWTVVSRSGTYFGGLQMDLAFQRSYGSDLLRVKGTADRWTPLEQMWVAERAYSSGRGFYPWPNTARYCGLI